MTTTDHIALTPRVPQASVGTHYIERQKAYPFEYFLRVSTYGNPTRDAPGAYPDRDSVREAARYLNAASCADVRARYVPPVQAEALRCLAAQLRALASDLALPDA